MLKNQMMGFGGPTHSVAKPLAEAVKIKLVSYLPASWFVYDLRTEFIL
jgi:hypothetical protein